MADRFICRGCSTALVWNGESIVSCPRCGKRYKMHPRSQGAPIQGRGSGREIEMSVQDSVLNGRAVYRCYVPSGWSFRSGLCKERFDMVTNLCVPELRFASEDGLTLARYVGETVYKHIEPTPVNARLQNVLDDWQVNTMNPSFLRMRSFMNARQYCDSEAVACSGLSGLSLIKEETASEKELAKQRETDAAILRNGFVSCQSEWIRRFYRGVSPSGGEMGAMCEARISLAAQQSVVPTLQYGSGLFGTKRFMGVANQPVINHLWNIGYELMLIAPMSRFDEDYAQALRITDSFTLLPMYTEFRQTAVNMAQQTLMQVQGVVNNAMSNMAQAQMASWDRKQNIISQTAAETHAIQQSIIANTAATHDRVANLHSESIRGVNSYLGRDGIVEASTAFDHVYQSTRDPDVYFAQEGSFFEPGVDFEELDRIT